jgi:Inner membrane protein CreD
LTPARIAAIGFIYCCAAVAWFTLGASVVERTGEKDSQLAQEVSQLWGGRHNQVAPDTWFESTRTVSVPVQEKDAQGNIVTRTTPTSVVDRQPVALASSRIDVALNLEQRQKGLLWYDTYGVAFTGEYRVRNDSASARTALIHFAFPSTEAIYDAFAFSVDGVEAPPASDLSQGLSMRTEMAPRSVVVVRVSYRSRGLGEWSYALTPSGVAQVRDFHLSMKTDFADIDFPAGTLSPTRREAQGGGYQIAWDFESLVTGQRVGMDPPSRLNPGPLAARITFFAPVSLLFFFSVMVILGVLQGRSLHPMNYFFLSAAFFAFHLLLAYLVDHMSIHLAFAIASATSVFLVVSYLRVVSGMRSALWQAGLAQFIYLVMFSYAFFFDGYTGLAVTLGSVVTLFVLMQATARVDWGVVFARPGPSDRSGAKA